MPRRLVLTLFALVVLAGTFQPPPAVRAQAPAPDAAKEARLRWFREAKYGLFIHWGLYAIPAGEWKGRTIPGIGEWIMNRARDPGRRIRASWRPQFNPVKFDAGRVGAARPGRRA